MNTIAWVLRDAGEKTEFSLENFEFEDISEDEVLAEPLIGSMEGNFVHAFRKKPENIFLARNEEKIILGNAGVVRILRTGSRVTNVREGDVCILFGNAVPDKYGYPIKVTGYDNSGSMGMFGKQIKLRKNEVIPIPDNTRLSLEQWAMFSLKFVTAWSNWKSAIKAYRIQMDIPETEMHVWGWGGGVSYAELKLASLLGCNTGMILSKPEMQKLCLANRIRSVDRNKPQDELIEEIMNYTNHEGVSIFIDNIGAATYPATMRMLSRQGVLTTCGWKSGGMYPVIRPYECISRHTHVFTHYAKYEDAVEAMRFAETHDWIPEYNGKIYDFDQIPDLLESFGTGKTDSYFNLFNVNKY